jgi:adenylate cyclase
LTVSKKAVRRRLAALLVVDAVGYSGLMRSNELATHAQIAADLKQLFAPIIKKHEGRVVKTTGDGMLAEFASIVKCVECAVAFQQAITAQQAKVKIEYRVGINLGDIIVEPDDVYGDGVNIASRIQAIAKPGGIVISGDAYQQVSRKVNVAFERMGAYNFKSVAEPVDVYQVVSHGKALSTGSEMPLPASGNMLPSVAILPFDYLGGNEDIAHLSDGITNDIITDISKFSDFGVVASHTVFSYRGKPIRIPDIGRELNVRYVVEGSVQRLSNRARINVQLIEVKSGAHLWAERYDRTYEALAEHQDELVFLIVGALVMQINQIEILAAQNKPTEQCTAYDHYLLGRAAWFQYTREGNRQAVAMFEKAIALEPSYARAHGYLAYTMVQARMFGWDQSPELIVRACEFAQRAVALGPTDFDNHWSLGGAYLYNREFDKALGSYERALYINPGSPGLLADWAETLLLLGRVDEAVDLAERAISRNPVQPDWFFWNLGTALYHRGEYEKALAALSRIGAPPHLLRRHLAAIYVRLNRREEAAAMVRDFMRDDPTYTLEREKVWPYKDLEMMAGFVDDLRAAGFPEKDRS